MAEDYQYISDIAVQNLETGDTILYGNKRDPRWLRIVEWVAEGNEIKRRIQPAVSFEDVRSTARQALSVIDWQDKVTKAESGQEKLDSIETSITAGARILDAINAAIGAISTASTLAQIRPPLLEALNGMAQMLSGILTVTDDERVLLQGLKDETVDNLKRTRALLQALAWTDDDTKAT